MNPVMNPVIKGHTFKAFIIIIKTPSYLLKINKKTNKNIFAIAIL